MIGLDTTVLLTHEIEEARGHHDLRAQIGEASQSGNLHLALAPQVLQEFVHAATDPKRFRIPLTMDQALTRSGGGGNCSLSPRRSHMGAGLEMDGGVSPRPQANTRYLSRGGCRTKKLGC